MTEAKVLASLRRILGATTLCSLSTVGNDGEPHICHVYFAFDEGLRVHFLSHPGSAHCRHIRRQGRAAVSVFDSHQRWGGPDAGVAMEGAARECRGASGRAAERTYSQRFDGYRAWTKTPDHRRFGRMYRFYTLTPDRVKVFDEPRLGAGRFAVARLRTERL